MTQILPSKIIGAGKGLFATCDIQPGEEVVRINKPVTFTTELQLSKYTKKQDNTRDCYIWVPSMKQYIGSKRNVNNENWYFMNHATVEANVKPQWDSNLNTIVWIAKKTIKKGDEIYFNYNPGCNVKF